MRQLIKYLEGYRKLFIMAIIAIVIATMLQLATPIIIKYAVDSVIGDEPVGNMVFVEKYFGQGLVGLVYLFVLVNLTRGIFLFIKGYFSNVAAEGIAENIRNKLYEHIQKMPFSFHSKCETGDLIQRCTSDVETLRRFLGVQIVDLGRIVFMIVLSILVMSTLSVRLTVYAVALVPILFLFSFVFFRNVQKRFTKSDEAEGELTRVLQENLSGVRVVRAFGREPYEIDKFEKVNQMHRETTFKLIELLGIFWSSADFMTLVQSGIVLLVGSNMVIQQEITLGTLIAFITYESMLLMPVKQSGRLLSELGKTTVAIRRIEEILGEPIETVDPNSLTPDIGGKIRFDHVSFAYEGTQQVLSDISFEVEAGKTLGILGATGSGKSTLVQLIQRLYPYEGEIYIDDVPLSKINQYHIRKQVGLIIQEPYLFAKNIQENISITKPEHLFSDVKDAAIAASIHHNIENFKEGYQTLVGEKGVLLSGGQKQRLAISRTLIDQEKPILIFDDSLSAVDSETDRRIRSALARRDRRATVIMISHRITSLEKADKIIVLDKGKIVQEGTHDQLLASEGTYRKIWSMQQVI